MRGTARTRASRRAGLLLDGLVDVIEGKPRSGAAADRPAHDGPRPPTRSSRRRWAVDQPLRKDHPIGHRTYDRPRALLRRFIPEVLYSAEKHVNLYGGTSTTGLAPLPVDQSPATSGGPTFGVDQRAKAWELHRSARFIQARCSITRHRPAWSDLTEPVVMAR